MEKTDLKRKKIFTVIQTVSILCLFATVALLILGWTNNFLTAELTLTLSIFIVTSLAAVLCMPWISKLKEPKQKILAIVLLSLIGLSAILWIISSIFIYLLYKNGDSYSAQTTAVFLNFIRACMIISFQAIEANMISLAILRYKNRHLALQIVMYLSYLYVDFWISVVIGGINFSASNVTFSPILPALFSTGAIVTLLIAIVYIVLASSIINSIDAKKNGGKHSAPLTESVLESLSENETENNIETKKEESSEEKLTKLKELFDKKLITEEEYNQKKSKILEEI